MNTANTLDFNPDALRKKYERERDKRLRSDGIGQYVDTDGQYSQYRTDDSYMPRIERAPVKKTVEVVLMGAGFGGILTGIQLRKIGVEDLCVIDTAGDFGGTWYWNRYPGAQCDIESYIYLPLLEEMDYIPKEKYSFAPEILSYSQTMAKKYDLYDGALFHTELQSMTWQEDSHTWLVKTDRGDEIEARYVCSSIGLLNRPKLPAVQGIETFKGHSFHTSRWDYAYTGGSSEGNLASLQDKKVAIIGTGATAVQCIPHLAESAKELYVFQRTPSSIDVRGNKPTDQEWANNLDEGWQRKRRDNFNILVTGGVQDEDLVNDGWTSIMQKLGVILADPSNSEDYADLTPEELGEAVELADFEKMEEIRARAASIVNNPEVAEKLKPYYRQFCKRPCFHDDYLPSFNKPNVHLIDTDGKGVSNITAQGVVFDGREYPVDCIIFATGFEIGTDYSRRAECAITGKGGATLEEKWAKGVRTLHGFQTNGFPNLFFMGLIQGGLTANNTHMLTEQSEHIAYLINRAKNGNYRSLEVSGEAEDDWVGVMKETALANEDFLAACTPGYYNDEGKKEINGVFGLQYGGGPDEFFRLLEAWRMDDRCEGVTYS